MFPLGVFAQLQCGQTIDFNTWSQEGLPASGVWSVSPGGNAVEQTFNGSATWFVSPNDFIDVTIQGSFQVNTSSDDDLIGFVFGYQNPFGALTNPSSTPMKSFIFDWKQTSQVFQGLSSSEGFALYEVDGPFDFTGLVVQGSGQVYPEFWERVNTPIVNVLDTDYGNNGWNDFQQYDFQLKYTTDSIVIWVDGVRIFEEDGCFEPGRFGFYNQSQDAVVYSNFSYDITYDFITDPVLCLGDTSFFEIGGGCVTSFPSTTSFDWNFGDGTTGSGLDPSHVYTTSGIYQAELVSSDPYGCLDTSTQLIEILDYPISNAGADEIVCGVSHSLNASPLQGFWTALNGGSFSDPTSANSSISVPGAGTYSFVWEATNAIGCSSSDTVSITFNDFNLNAVLTDVSCSGGADGEVLITTSNGVQPVTYQWTTPAGNQIANPVVNLTAGPVALTLTDGTGCVIDTSFVIQEPSPFTFNLDVFPSDCDIADGEALVSAISGGTGPYLYDWGMGVDVQPILSGLSAGTYSLIISDNNGCDTTVNFSIMNDPFTPSASVVQDISCFGLIDGEAIASGPSPSASYTYQWGASSNFQTTQVATNLPAGSHEVTITSAEGCVETLSVVVVEPSELLVSLSDTAVCIGSVHTFEAFPSGGTPVYTYSWNNSSGQPINPIDFTVLQNDTISITVTDANNCQVSDSMILIGLEAPTASFNVDELVSCMFPVINFNFVNTSIPASANVVWDFGDGSTASGNSVSHSFGSPGTYSIGIEVTGTNGCVSSLVQPNYISIFPNPIADFTFSPNQITSLFPTIQFIDLSYDDIVTWEWTLGTDGTSSLQHPNHDFNPSDGSQLITLEVENIHGCIDSTSRLIEAGELISIYAPNAFTPDDDEFNQTWRIYLEGLDIYDVEIRIYNRWGETVWESHDASVGWDGTYNGRIVPDGVYTWTLKVGLMDTDERYERVGHVNVLR